MITSVNYSINLNKLEKIEIFQFYYLCIVGIAKINMICQVFAVYILIRCNFDFLCYIVQHIK